VDIVNSMRMFAKVAELNSFVRASESLDIAVPRFSRALAELEEHLGTRLLQRTTRRMSLTEAGRLIWTLPQYRLADREFRIVYSNRKFLSLKVKAFIEITVEPFRKADEPQFAAEHFVPA
jgi:DNA-binding transcriptional LysR family regulator